MLYIHDIDALSLQLHYPHPHTYPPKPQPANNPPIHPPTLTTTLPSFLPSRETKKKQETINPLLPHLITSYHNPYPIPQEKQPLYNNTIRDLLHTRTHAPALKAPPHA